LTTLADGFAFRLRIPESSGANALDVATPKGVPQYSPSGP
jgi:hypothetical protein